MVGYKLLGHPFTIGGSSKRVGLNTGITLCYHLVKLSEGSISNTGSSIKEKEK